MVETTTITSEFSGLYGHNGNGKLGPHVSIISREAGATCPGASKKCLGFCFAKKGNYLRYGHQAKYAASVIALPSKLRPMFRFHPSGDFDTVHYIEWCAQLVVDHPAVVFWAYTRSWEVPELLPWLEALRSLPNMQLFASVDTDMPDPPDGWRAAYDETDPRAKGKPVCMEERKINPRPNCEGCNYCPKGKHGDVVWLLH